MSEQTHNYHATESRAYSRLSEGDESLRATEAELRAHHDFVVDDTDHHIHTERALATLAKADDVFDQEHPEEYGVEYDQIDPKIEADMLWLAQVWRDQTKEIRLGKDQYETYDEAMDEMNEGNYSDEVALELVKAFKERFDYFNVGEDAPGIDELTMIHGDRLRAVYEWSEEGQDNPLHQIIDGLDISKVVQRDKVAQLLDKCTYNLLLPYASSDIRVKKLVDTYEHPADIQIDLLKRSFEDFNDLPVEYSISERVDQIMESFGLPQAMSREYCMAAFLRNRIRSGEIDKEAMQSDMLRVREVYTRYGSEEMLKLYNAIGLEQPWAYRDEELDMLVGLVNKDPAVISRLQSQDFSMVLQDVRGDFNGAVTNPSAQQTYGLHLGNTVRFEMTSAESIYRRFIFLNKLGLKPSAVIYAAHGDPGVSAIGRGVRMTAFSVDGLTQPREGIFRNININLTQLAKLGRDYMQRDRDGNRKIVLVTCSGDKQVSTYSDRKKTSFAESVARTVNLRDTTVVAGEEMFGIRNNYDGTTTFIDGEVEQATGQETSTTRVLKIGRKLPWARRPSLHRQSVEKFKAHSPSGHDVKVVRYE